MKNMMKSCMGMIGELKHSIPSMPDLSVYEGKLEAIRLSIPEIKETILDNPAQIRDKLESIRVESEKLSIDSISYLKEELKKLEKKINTAKGITIFGGGGGGGAGKIVKAYDLSSSLNSVLKTFTIPGNWRVISVNSSSFPFMFRPTIDYTTTDSSITFTDEVIADTMLTTGQSIAIIYAEP